jgi:hypothetical protein
VNHAGVLETRGVERALQVAAAPRGALHEVDAGVRERRGEREARPARPGAEIGDPPRRADGVDLERRERVGDVAIDRLGGVADRRRGRRVGRLVREQPLQRGDAARRHVPARGDVRQRRHPSATAARRRRIAAIGPA